MKVYFSHPTFTFGTDTEEFCVGMIRDYFEDVQEVVNPSDFGLKHDVKSLVCNSDKVVGMAVMGRYTFLVWNEMEEGEREGADLFTIDVQNKEKIGEIERGMPEDIQKLSKEESEKFTNDLLTETREGVLSVIFGKHTSRF